MLADPLRTLQSPGPISCFPWLVTFSDNLQLRWRALMESIHDPLKNISQVEPTRHRSLVNSLVQLWCEVDGVLSSAPKPSLPAARQLDRDSVLSP